MSQALNIQDTIAPVSFELFAKDFDAFTQRLGDSYARWGFAVISDHGMPQDKVDAAIDQMKAFFALPEEAKKKYKLGVGGQRGYTPFGIETAKGATHFDLKEFWHVGRDLPPGHRFRDHMADNVWPDAELPEFHEKVQWLYSALDAMGLKVLESIAVYLGLDRHFFDDKVDDGNSILRLLHYPPQTEPPPEGSVRAGAHEDINVITLLLGAEEGGLEVLHRNGQWLGVNPPAGSLVVNVGDMLQRLTNHVYPSTTHRVVNPPGDLARKPRYSVPFFLHPNPDVVLDPLASCITPDNPSRYSTSITSHEYLMERLREIKLA